MDSKYIKARCSKYNRWFAIELQNQHGAMQAVNFVNMTEEESKQIQTEVSGDSFRVAPTIRRCCKCSTDKIGTCSHIEGLKVGGRSLCDVDYSYQCLFCKHLRISKAKADADRFNPEIDIKNIKVKRDRFGNLEGSQFDLAKDGGFRGHKIVFLCLYTGEGILQGVRQPIRALEKKGFTVDLFTSATPQVLREKLRDASQFWLLSDKVPHLNNEHLAVIRDFYNEGRGVYILGDNDPFYVDANFVSSALVGVTMSGNTLGDKVIGVQRGANSPGIIDGHLIARGIDNLYEGITIAEVRTSGVVKPLVKSSAMRTVTAIVEDGKHKMLIDGGFTRLYHKWDTAGTDRFVVNCAAWLASSDGGGEIPFT